MASLTEKGIHPPPNDALLDDRARWAPWERWFRLITRAMPKIQVFTVTWNPAAIAANTTAEQTVTVTGVKLNRDVVLSINKPTATAGVGIVGWRVSADDTVAVTWVNATGSSVNPGEEDYIIVTMRK